jgi:hypothetical protein
MRYLWKDEANKPSYWPQNIPFCSVTKREQGKNVLNKKQLVKIVLQSFVAMNGIAPVRQALYL